MKFNFPEIVCTEDTLSGSPRIIGRRLAVGDVISLLKGYGTLEEVINDFELPILQIRQALQYCSKLQCKTDKPAVLCHNCSLRRQQEGSLDISGIDEIRGDKVTYVKGDNSIFLGSMEELLQDWNGENWWEAATDLLIDLRNELSDNHGAS